MFIFSYHPGGFDESQIPLYDLTKYINELASETKSSPSHFVYFGALCFLLNVWRGFVKLALGKLAVYLQKVSSFQ